MQPEHGGTARLRVLAVLPNLHGGGSERVMTTLLRHLDLHRFDPVLAVVDGRGADLRDQLPDGLRWLDLGCPRVARAAPALWRLIRSERPHVVLSTLGHLNLTLAMMKPLLPASVRLLARESSIVSNWVTRERRPGAWRLAYRLFYRRLDGVICQSKAMQADLCGHYGVSAARTVVIPNPLDLAHIQRLAQEPPPFQQRSGTRLLAVGRLAAEKGMDVLLQAVALCPQQDLHLDVLGQGPHEEQLKEQTRQLGLGERVHFQGFQRNPYVWMQHADALVLSSRYEGLPNVVLESLACGTPVITTPVPSALEIVAGMSDAVVAEGFDAMALAAAMQRWLQGPRKPADPAVVVPYGVAAITRRYEQALTHAAANV